MLLSWWSWFWLVVLAEATCLRVHFDDNRCGCRRPHVIVLNKTLGIVFASYSEHRHSHKPLKKRHNSINEVKIYVAIRNDASRKIVANVWARDYISDHRVVVAQVAHIFREKRKLNKIILHVSETEIQPSSIFSKASRTRALHIVQVLCSAGCSALDIGWGFVFISVVVIALKENRAFAN